MKDNSTVIPAEAQCTVCLGSVDSEWKSCPQCGATQAQFLRMEPVRLDHTDPVEAMKNGRHYYPTKAAMQ